MDEVTHNQPELSELLRVRREKLEALRAAGQDPFVITQFKRSHSCNDILTVSKHWKENVSRLPGAS